MIDDRVATAADDAEENEAYPETVDPYTGESEEGKQTKAGTAQQAPEEDEEDEEVRGEAKVEGAKKRVRAIQASIREKVKKAESLLHDSPEAETAWGIIDRLVEERDQLIDDYPDVDFVSVAVEEEAAAEAEGDLEALREDIRALTGEILAGIDHYALMLGASQEKEELQAKINSLREDRHLLIVKFEAAGGVIEAEKAPEEAARPKSESRTPPPEISMREKIRRHNDRIENCAKRLEHASDEDKETLEAEANRLIAERNEMTVRYEEEQQKEKGKSKSGEADEKDKS